MHGMKRRGAGRMGGRGPLGGPVEGNGLFGGRRGTGRGGIGGGPGGLARRGKRFSGEEMRLMVLGLLETETQHGYQLIRNFAQKSGDVYTPSPGMLYPLLTMLADMGLVEEVADESSGARRSYGLTDAGKVELAAKQDLLTAAMAKLAGLAELAGRTDTAPVRRAMMNLRAATMQRLSREGTAPDLGFDVAAILDEAAQKIERLGS